MWPPPAPPAGSGLGRGAKVIAALGHVLKSAAPNLDKADQLLHRNPATRHQN